MISRAKISAIVSTYNTAEFIDDCLDNLIKQTVCGELEIIVIDSGSQQNERTIVRSYMKRFPNISYIRTERRETLYKAWNRAIRLAHGKYITTANTDDLSRKDAYEIMARTLDVFPKLGLVYSDMYLTKSKNDVFRKRNKTWTTKRRPEYSRRALFKYNMIGPRPMYRKIVHDRIGFFNPKYISIGDYEFWLRMSEYYEMKRIPKPLTLCFMNPKGIYHSSMAVGIKEAREVCRNYLGGRYLHWTKRKPRL